MVSSIDIHRNQSNTDPLLLADVPIGARLGEEQASPVDAAPVLPSRTTAPCDTAADGHLRRGDCVTWACHGVE
jgi:hypothetical protein